MKVKNINGTSDSICECESWLDHWKKFSGQSPPTYCSEKNCTKKPEVDAMFKKTIQLIVIGTLFLSAVRIMGKRANP